MKTISLVLSLDEVDMLNGWLGQLSDGVGENKSWTTPYWKNLSFDTTGITIQDENARPFKGKSDKDILEDLGDRFIDISNECLAYGSLSDYFDDKRNEDLNLGVNVANSIVKKFTGNTNIDEWDLYTQEDFDRMAEEQAKLDTMVENCNKGIMDLYTKLAELTGEEPPKTLEDCMWKPEDGDFYEKLKELDNDK